MMIKEAIYNAITLQLFSEEAFEFIGIQSKTDQDTPRKEQYDRVGIKSANLFFSLGIYGKVFMLLIGLLLVYILAVQMSKRIKKIEILKKLLHKKLFYNAWIRFLITSNLKITHNVIFVLHFQASFASK